jgi:hypothetical protein
MAAVALRREETLEQRPADRDEILARYRHLRAIGSQHLNKAVALLSSNAILQQAKRLGLMFGRTIVLEDENEIGLVYDLLIHTAPPGRTRAIDRYAASVKLQQGSDEALILEALRNARFVVFTVKERHPSVGLIVIDYFRDSEFWLVNEGLEKALPDGATFVTRVYAPEGFAMTARIGISVDRDILVEAVETARHLLRKTHAQAIDDRRFAEAVYRAGLAARRADGDLSEDGDEACRSA